MLRQLAITASLMLTLTALAPSLALAQADAQIGSQANAQAAALLSPTDEILTTLRSRGYEIVENERTWLGRQRVLATKDGTSREIVFIPATGEILRDYAMQLAQQPGNRLADNEGTGADRATVGATAATHTTDATPSVSVGDAIGVTRGNEVDVSADGSPP